MSLRSTIKEHPMYVIEQTRPEPTPLPGIEHATWAGAADGLTELSVWRQSLAPGAGTPPHSHGCDEIVLCLAGSGEVHVGTDVHRFGPAATVVLPKGSVHQLVNTGSTAMEIVGIFAATPVSTRLPDGESIDLPWRS
jgi:quercetin dioxygenase-like cupin family protein